MSCSPKAVLPLLELHVALLHDGRGGDADLVQGRRVVERDGMQSDDFGHDTPAVALAARRFAVDATGIPLRRCRDSQDRRATVTLHVDDEVIADGVSRPVRRVCVAASRAAAAPHHGAFLDQPVGRAPAQRPVMARVRSRVEPGVELQLEVQLVRDRPWRWPAQAPLAAIRDTFVADELP